jgi:hypothetical protein
MIEERIKNAVILFYLAFCNELKFFRRNQQRYLVFLNKVIMRNYFTLLRNCLEGISFSEMFS